MIHQRHCDIAAYIQQSIEYALSTRLRRLADLYGCDRVCISGGLALNAVANTTLHGIFPGGVYVPSAPGDDGQCLGNIAAVLSHERGAAQLSAMRTGRDARLGPDIKVGSARLTASLRENELATAIILETDDLAEALAEMISEGWIVGLFQGRSELGPRALGARSILADARDQTVVDRLNLLKNREAFMPFAPAVLEDRQREWFVEDVPSPFMSFAVKAAESARTRVPAVVHRDGSARVQSVRRGGGGLIASILESLETRTGIPVVLNTSLNAGGRPIDRR